MLDVLFEEEKFTVMKIKYVKHLGHLSNDVIWNQICVPHKTQLIAPPEQWSQFEAHSTITCLSFLLLTCFLKYRPASGFQGLVETVKI